MGRHSHYQTLLFYTLDGKAWVVRLICQLGGYQNVFAQVRKQMEVGIVRFEALQTTQKAVLIWWTYRRSEFE